MRGFTGIAVAVATAGGLAGAAAALEAKPVLSLEAAQKMIAGCIAKAEAEGWRMSVAVVDAGSDPVAFARMDGAFTGSIAIAWGKADTSAKFPFQTGFAANLAYGAEGKPAPLPGFAEVPGMIAFAGGMPIMAGEVHVGGIGVSGARAGEDEECAKAGLAAAADDLK